MNPIKSTSEEKRILKLSLLHTFSLFLCALIIFVACQGCSNPIENNEWENPRDPNSPTWNPPTVIAKPIDSNLAVRDTQKLFATGSDSNGQVIGFLWSHDQGQSWPETTSAGTLHYAWRDSGIYTIYVRAMDNDSSLSNSDSIQVYIDWFRPYLTPTLLPGVFPINDSISIYATGGDSNGAVIAYLWSFDLGASWPETTTVPELHTNWSDSGKYWVHIRNMDEDSVLSKTESLSVHIDWFRPRVALNTDSVIFPMNDSAFLIAKAADSNGQVQQLVWSFDQGQTWSDGTTDSILYRIWSDSGDYPVWVKAIDDDGIESNPDSIRIQIHPFRPQFLPFQPIHNWPINDTLTLKVQAWDGNGKVMGYAWSKDEGVNWSETTMSDSLKVCWSDSGDYTILAKAMDDDSLYSPPETLQVNIGNHHPTVIAFPDTFVSYLDTLTISLAAEDSNGTIEMYYLDYNLNGIWDDSSTSGELALSTHSGGFRQYIWAAKDDDGMISSSDSFWVNFNRPPVLDSLEPVVWSTWDETSLSGTLRLQVFAHDPEMDSTQRDSVHYQLQINNTILTVSSLDSIVEIGAIQSGQTYTFDLTLYDAFGDSSTHSDTISVGVSCSETGPMTFTDERDGQVYRCTRIGSQVWMRDNLNYNSGEGSYCYDDDPANCEIYGRLYTWYEAMNGAEASDAVPSGVQGICPDGWHLPSTREWETMIVNAGVDTNNYTQIDMLANSFFHPDTGWLIEGSCEFLTDYAQENYSFPYKNSGGDQVQFTALPSGFYQSDSTYPGPPDFYGQSCFTAFWSTDLKQTYAPEQTYSSFTLFSMPGGHNFVSFDYNQTTDALSIRCLK